MSDSPERREMAQRIIEKLKSQWRTWNNLVQNKGQEEEEFNTKEYEFVVDRRDEEKSFFTANYVRVTSLNKPLEDWDWLETEPKPLKTEEGEEWLQITVCPKDPYRLKLGRLSINESDFYYTEELTIFMSNQGRAFEQTIWASILSPDIHQPQFTYLSYLKRYPQPEEIQVEFTEEPEKVLTEPFQSLKGQNLERLGFLLEKVSTDDIIETKF